MKKNLIIPMVILLVTGFIFTSCEKDYQVYDSDLAAVRLNLENFTDNADSLVFSFALRPGVIEDTVAIPVKILGFTSSVSRSVKMLVDAKKTTAVEGEDFVLEACQIAADSVNGQQRVIVRRKDKLNAKDICIALEIADSPDLTAGPVDERCFRIILSNQLMKPSDWVQQFGEYSRVKHEFVIKVTGQGTDYDSWNRDYILVTYYVQLLNKALAEYNNAHPDDPLVDENGIPVSFPG